MYDVVFIGNKMDSATLNSLCLKPDQLMKCWGEIGDFNLVYQDKGELSEIKTATIIVNIDADREKLVPGALSFEDELPEGNENLLLVQDFQVLSPAYISKIGLTKALSALSVDPEINIYYFYRSIRFSDDNDYLYEQTRKKGVVFLKYEPENLRLQADSILYHREDISIELKGKLLIASQFKPADSLKRVARILNLSLVETGYMQAENVYLQPSRSSRRGIYLLGGSRGPTAYTSLQEDKELTLNEIEYLLNHLAPATDDRRVVDEQKCALCYTCYRVCPHGALQRDDQLDAMKVLTMACQGCNTCISHCPAAAISLEQAEEEKQNSDLTVFMCENSAWTAWERLKKKQDQVDFQIEKIPCAGSINKEILYQHLQKKSDRILVLGCFQESCQHLTGDQKAARMIKELNQQLKALNLGADRITFIQMAPRMKEDLTEILSCWKEGKL